MKVEATACDNKSTDSVHLESVSKTKHSQIYTKYLEPISTNVVHIKEKKLCATEDALDNAVYCGRGKTNFQEVSNAQEPSTKSDSKYEVRSNALIKERTDETFNALYYKRNVSSILKLFSVVITIKTLNYKDYKLLYKRFSLYVMKS